ncbi:MAG: thioredoxin family protein [Bacteroidales bacterium]|nr:thioredoxin family protein [Bacteroidales bacterium]MEE1097739.1 thioredoxin family protein [Bacteroidales bacterium]
MRKVILACMLCLIMSNLNAQKLYDEKANWKEQVENSLKKAEKENKHLLIQFGGNWCKWCIMFDRFVQSDNELKQLVDSNFVILHLDYKKQEDLLAFTDYADRFGFPVLLIYDSNGKRLHTQSTDLLEQGEGYDKKKVYGVLRNWTPAATSGKFRRSK